MFHEQISLSDSEAPCQVPSAISHSFLAVYWDEKPEGFLLYGLCFPLSNTTTLKNIDFAKFMTSTLYVHVTECWTKVGHKVI